MKVTQIQSVKADSDDKIEAVDRNSIDFTAKGSKDGELVAICPIQLPNSGANGDTRKFIATVALKVRSQSETSSKGKIRHLVEVSLPYVAISPSVADDAIVANQFDSKRSGARMSIHAVVELPKAAVDDMRGAFGSTCQRGASAQLAVLQMLFGAMLQAAGQPAGYMIQQMGDDTGTVKLLPNVRAKLGTHVIFPTEGSVTDQTLLVDENSQAAGAMPQIKELSEYPGITGIDASACVDLAGGLTSGVMRAINGVQTLDVTGNYPVPQVVLPYNYSV